MFCLRKINFLSYYMGKMVQKKRKIIVLGILKFVENSYLLRLYILTKVILVQNMCVNLSILVILLKSFPLKKS